MRIWVTLLCILLASTLSHAQQAPKTDPRDRKYKLFGPADSKAKNATRSVEGMVIDKDGKPVKGAVVRVRNMKTNAVRYLTTGPDGGYRFEGLARNIDYHVHATFGDIRSRSHTIGTLDTSQHTVLNLRVEMKRREKVRPPIPSQLPNPKS
jgi:hypothetical protein